MKIRDGFITKEIAGTIVVVPVGRNAVSFKSVITLNESGAFLWKLLQEEKTEEELIASLLGEYDIDEATAKADVASFIAKLNEAELLK